MHDLRIAIRRLASSQELVPEARKPAGHKQAMDRLRRQLKHLGPVRDRDIIEAYLSGRVQRQPGLARHIKAIRRDRGKMAMAAIAGIEQETSFDSMQGGAGGPKPGQMEQMLQRAFSRMVEARDAVRDPATAHRLRVVFKKFRYTAEAVQPLVPSITPALMRSLQRFQRFLGEIQDLTVIAGFLKARENKDAGTGVPATLLKSCQAGLARLMARLPTEADALIAAWRGISATGNDGVAGSPFTTDQ